MRSNSPKFLISVVLTISAASMACALCGWIGLIGMREMQVPTLFGAATIGAPREADVAGGPGLTPRPEGAGTATGIAVSQPKAPGAEGVDSTPAAIPVTPNPGSVAPGGTPSPAPALSSELKGVLVHVDFGSKEMSGLNGLGTGTSDAGDSIWSAGKYTILIKRVQQRLSEEIIGIYKDFGVEIEAQPEDKNIFYGIEFRAKTDAQADEDYLFAALPSGGHMLEKRINGVFVQPGPVPPQESPHLYPGASRNRLGVLAEGSTISLYINGYLVNTITDASLSSGRIRLVVGTFPDTVVPAKVDFSRVTVMTAERAKVELGKKDGAAGAGMDGLLFYDDFSSDRLSTEKGWAVPVDQDQEGSFSPDGLIWRVKTKGLFMMTRPNIASLKDFGVEIEAKPDDVPGTKYGVLIRYGGASQDTLSHYYFGVSTDGTYFVGKSVNGKFGVAPVSTAASPYIQTGASKNRLGVLVEGPTISLFINGRLVKTAIDNSISSGSIGVFVMSPETGPTRVSFSSLSVITPERAKREWDSQLGAAGSRGYPEGVLFEENFASEEMTKSNGWVLGEADGAGFGWSPNKLSLNLETKGKAIFDAPTIGFADFGAEFELQPGNDPGTEYGITYRGNKDRSSYYLFAVTLEGKYFLSKRVDGKQADPELGSLAPSSSLKKGPASNRLGVIAEGPTFSLFINGTLVRTVTDDSLTDGYVGVFVQAQGERARLDVSRMTVLSAQKAKTEWNPSGILFQDDFHSEQLSIENGWTFGTSETYDSVWSPNKLTMTVKEIDTVGSNYPYGSFKDLGIEVEAQPLNLSGEYGIRFRQTGTKPVRSEYYFGVTTAGKYYLHKILAGKVASPQPIEDTFSPYIRTGASKNRMGVLASGSKISLYINGNLVNTVTDNSIGSGGVGVFLMAAEDRTSLAVNRFNVYTAEKAVTALAANPSTPEPTATATTTPKPTATATAPRKPTATATPTGILFTDDFGSEQASINKGWVFDSEDTWASNRLTMSVTDKRMISWENVPAGILTDFGAEVEAQPQGPSGIEYGMMFRSGGSAEERTYYLFGITTGGQYYLYKKVGGKWSDKDPVPDTISRYVNTGAAKNRLGVLANGQTISLYINGNLVKTVADSSIASGRVALFLDNIDNDQAVVAFRRVTIYTVDRARTELGKR